MIFWYYERRIINYMEDDDIKKLKSSLIYKMSLGSKELYHSNVWAFDQAQKEVDDLHERTKEGIQTAKLNGRQIGSIPGSKYNVKKSVAAKEEIKKNLARGLKDTEIIKLVRLSRNTYYKYKKEINEGD